MQHNIHKLIDYSFITYYDFVNKGTKRIKIYALIHSWADLLRFFCSSLLFDGVGSFV